MPGFTCCVPGCYNNSHRDRDLRFYTFPKDEEQRRVWLQNISRTGVTGCFSTFYPTTGHRVCSAHFPGGRKTYSINVPTIFPLRGVREEDQEVPQEAASSRARRRQAHRPVRHLLLLLLLLIVLALSPRRALCQRRARRRCRRRLGATRGS